MPRVFDTRETNYSTAVRVKKLTGGWASSNL
jgi:hypothetical protein